MKQQTSHAHNVSKRRVNINLQRVRVLLDGRVQHIRVSTRAIKSGLITRPPVKLRQRKAKVLQPQVAAAVAAAATLEAPVAEFFSDASVVSRLFKPKKPATAEGEAAAEELEATETGEAATESEEAAPPVKTA
jgi:large subunit ribosomal protein L28